MRPLTARPGGSTLDVPTMACISGENQHDVGEPHSRDGPVKVVEGIMHI
jgi:hypothetical protein